MLQLLVTLRENVSQATAEALRSQVLMWDGVANATELEFDPDTPDLSPYFVVYMDTEILLDEVVERLKKTTLVESVEIPPLRYCASDAKAISQKKANTARRFLNA